MQKILNALGLAALLLCFAASTWRVVLRPARQRASGQVELRLAHWQLESSAREAFAGVMRDYEQLHPGVRVVQDAIPVSVFPEWATTQLVGGTAPDLVQIGINSSGVDSAPDERLVRYYVPLTSALAVPNPYNAGTDLAATPWRETFVDGLHSAYNPRLLEYYNAPTTLTTVRVFYNRPLWRHLFGDEERIPQTYAEFIDLCRRARAANDPAHPIVPIAGSGYTSYWLVNALFGSQVQRVWLDKLRGLDSAGEGSAERVERAFLTGRETLDDPALRSGLAIEREAAGFMQPGFLQLERGDAMFLFAQGKALMIAAGSWDASTLRAQTPFEIGAFPVPLPAPDDPTYGKFVLGPESEAGRATSVTFALYAGSPHREQALDFLRFLTSRAENAAFARRSGWLPAVVGVSAPPDMRAFEPQFEGYPNGFDLSPGADTARVIGTSNYLLYNASGSVDRFVEAIRPEYAPAVASELGRKVRDAGDVIALEDTALAAYRRLAAISADAAERQTAAAKVSELNESENQREINMYGIACDLHAAGAGAAP